MPCMFFTYPYRYVHMFFLNGLILSPPPPQPSQSFHFIWEESDKIAPETLTFHILWGDALRVSTLHWNGLLRSLALCCPFIHWNVQSFFVCGSSVSESLTKRVRTFTLEMTVPSVDVFQLHCDPSDTQHHHSQASLALECQVVGLVSWWPFRTICGTWTLQRLLDSECLTLQSHILPSQSFQWNGNISYESALKWMSCFQEPIFGWRGLFFALYLSLCHVKTRFFNQG